MRATATAALALVAALGVAAPAGAQRATIADPKEPVVGDIARVMADHAPENLFVHTSWRDGAYDAHVVYIDTQPGNPGPEFKSVADTSYTSGYVARSLRRVDRFRPPYHYDGGVAVRCPRHTAWLSQDRTLLKVKVPRACLRIGGRAPARVRVSVVSVDETGYGDRDWAPRAQTFGPWLARG